MGKLWGKGSAADSNALFMVSGMLMLTRRPLDSAGAATVPIMNQKRQMEKHVQTLLFCQNHGTRGATVMI